MKDRKPEYNLLDLIESSSRNRQNGPAPAAPRPAEAPDDDVRIYKGSNSEPAAGDAPVDEERAAARDNGRNSIRFNIIDEDPAGAENDAPVSYESPDSYAEDGWDDSCGDRRGDSDHYDPDDGYEAGDHGERPESEAGTGSRGIRTSSRVAEWFRTFPARTADFFRHFPERFAKGWEHFKPEWRLFWKHAAWKKVWDRAFLLLLFPLCFFIRHFLSQYPAEVDSFYSDGLNYVIRMVLNVASTLTSVPVFDVICWLTIIIAVILLVIMVIRIHNEKTWHRKWYVVCGYASGAAVFLAVMFFIYQLNFGLNDYRLTLDKIMKLDVQAAESAELTETCRDLVFRASEVRKYLNEDEQGVVSLPDRDAVLTGADDGFAAGTRFFGNLTFLPSMSLGKQSFDMSVAKFTSFSFIMSGKDKTCTYQPFTGEVLVNGSTADYMLPAVVCQGLGAQMGFTDREACDFLAFLAAINHSDPYYDYSGLMLGLDKCMARLRTLSPAAYSEVRGTFTPEMERDISSGGELGWFGEPDKDKNGIEIPVEDTLTTGLILSYYRDGYMKDVQIGVHTGDGSAQKTEDVQETTAPAPTLPPQNTAD